MPDISIKITDGTHHSPVNTPTGDYMYVTAKNIKDDGVMINGITYVSKEVHNEIYSRCNPEFGDILYIKDGATTGVVTINNLSDPFSLLSSVALIKLGESINNKYVMYAMRSPVFYGKTRDLMQGTGITRITLTVISNLIFPLPPIEEQARIVARVDELMAKIDEYEKIEKQLTELHKAFPGNMKDAILQAAMQGKLTEQLESDGDAFELQKHLSRVKTIKSKTKEDIQGELPYEVPESWATPKLGEVFDIIMGSSPKGEEISNDQTEGVEFHQGKIAFTNELIGQSGLYTTNKSKIVPMNSALLCVRAPIGTVNITDRPIVIGRGLCSITPVGNVSLRFILYVLRTLEKTFVDKGTGSTFKAITADVILNQKIPLPPIEEQQRIVDKLDQLLPLCERLEKMVV